jgi:hypothetical protein
MNLAAGAITSFSDFMTVLCVAQDSKPECRHRAARVLAVVAPPLGHRRDAHGAKYPAIAICDRTVFVEAASADRRQFLGEVWMNERG